MKRKIKRLELHIARHCNMSCRGCSHLAPLASSNYINEDITIQSLKILEPLLTCDTVHLLGGEPLLYDNITEFAYKVKQIGIANKISLATNGLLLDKVDRSFWNVIDEVNISIYNYNNDIINKITECAKQISLDYNTKFNLYYFESFREPYSEVKCQDTKLVQQVYESCVITHNWQCFNLYNDFLFKCPQACILVDNVSIGGSMANGVKITKDNELQQNLTYYLESSTPLPACYHCLGAVGKKFPIQQIKNKEKWRSYQQKDYKEMIDSEFMEKILQANVSNIDSIDTTTRTVHI